MTEGPLVPVARVIKAHGLKGEVSVAPLLGGDFPLSVGTEVWFVPPPASVRTARVMGIRMGPKGPLVAFDSVCDINQASALANSRVLVRREDARAPYTEERPDPVGLAVTDVIHGALGQVVEVIETGANDVWVVDGPHGEIMLPVIQDVILKIDEEARSVKVRLLDGLLPDEGRDP